MRACFCGTHGSTPVSGAEQLYYGGYTSCITQVEADDQPELHSLAPGIRRDQEAVTAGLALPCSSAAMEGNVNKIKMIKRQMYGRAGFDLLGNRVILHPG